ncbi:transposase [Paraburkholderia sp. BL8N3]|nr:transposase [Paraburkholderia sp. BL8N3]
MAYGIHPLFPLAAQRRLGARGPCAGARGRSRACADRFDRHPSTPAFGRSAEKNGPQALGRSRGGLSTKIHLAVDSLGRALRLILTEGQVADISCAQELVDGLRFKAVIADKGYDSDAFVKSIRASRAKAVIPPRSNRKIQRRYDRMLYRQRNLVERFFNRIKHFRRVATRYDKLAHSYLTFVSIVSAFGPLVNVNRA